LTSWMFLKMRCIDIWVTSTMFFAQSFNVSMILKQVNVSSVDLYLLTQHHLLVLHEIKILMLWLCLRMIKISFTSFTMLLRTSSKTIATFATRSTLTWSWLIERNNILVINALRTEESILIIWCCDLSRTTWTHCVYSSIFLNCFWLRKCW